MPLHYPHPHPPAAGALIEVVPGVFWLRMPLPFQLNHINLWLLRDGDGWTLVDTGFANDEVRAIWEQELTDMRQRIQRMRLLFVNTLQEKGASRDFTFITKQNGMFSFSGLTKEQVLRLREEFAIYAVASGRINVAGMTPDNMSPLCEAIVAVL